jgi:hypothetical protein
MGKNGLTLSKNKYLNKYQEVSMKMKLIFGITVMVILAVTACNKGGSSGSANAQSGGKTINSATELRTYLDSQPVNGPDKPIRVSMTINDPMIESISEVIESSGKYVSLNITGNILTTIPWGAFQNCKTLAGITIPNSVTEIEYYAFSNNQLTSITIPNSVTTIGGNVFAENKLTSVTIPNSITKIEKCTFHDNQLTSITIPNGVTEIRPDAFSFNQLTSVTIPNSVTEIGVSAFAMNPLTSITIGANVDIYRSSQLIKSEPGNFVRIGFDAAYNSNGKAAGTYTRPNTDSTTWTKQ